LKGLMIAVTSFIAFSLV